MNPKPMAESEPGARERASIEGYYRLHSKIYDATRWTFLFGRNAILREIAGVTTPKRILEVGCGTGKNLVSLCRAFPQAEVTGVDLSETMLDLSRRKTRSFGSRVRLIRGAYGAGFDGGGGGDGRDDGVPYDLILFSYALSMFNPGFEEAIATAHRDLAEGGHIAVVDFHDTRFPIFASWMGVNHVRMDGQLHPLLMERFTARAGRLRGAYGFVWRYLLFVGRK